MLVHDYKKLKVWQKSLDLVELVYEFSRKLPEEEKFGLRAQMQRASVSIPSNIAEGSRGRTEKDFKYFLIRALGSASELETQIEICRRIYLKDEILKIPTDLLIEIMKMLNKLIEKNSEI